jgi:hypothetical protein
MIFCLQILHSVLVRILKGLEFLLRFACAIEFLMSIFRRPLYRAGRVRPGPGPGPARVRVGSEISELSGSGPGLENFADRTRSKKN